MAEGPADRPDTHLVVLLHGLGRRRTAMAPLARRLAREGYRVANVGYPSTRAGVDAHAARVASLLERHRGVTRVSFVTHSLGGIVVRALGERDDPWRRRIALGRMVMLAPPNQGSALARRVNAVPALARFFGPSLDDVVRRVPAMAPPPLPFGVIAGSTLPGRGLNPLVGGDDDGIVRVAETWLAGSEDHLVVPGLHTFIMLQPAVHAATVRFLATGRFRGPASGHPPQTDRDG